jgi:hypothetical protein
VLHWQALHRQLPGSADNGSKREEALVLLAFSCPEADNLKEPSSPNVRATLHASFYLLRLVPGAENGAAKCRLTRILSYDLGGQIPQNLATTVLMQQAGLPGVLSKHLKRVEPIPHERLSTSRGGEPLSNEEVIRDVTQAIIERDNTALVSSARRRLSFDMSVQEKLQGGGTRGSDSPGESRAQKAQAASAELSIPYTAMILLLPVILHRFVSMTVLATSGVFVPRLLHPAVVFCTAAFFAIRNVVVRYLGDELDARKSQLLKSHQGDPVTCRLSVDLKGVLRFMTMKKEEKKERAATTNHQSAIDADISVVHIVGIALARAMQQHSDCWKRRRVRIPFLWIDGYYEYPSQTLDVSVSITPGNQVCLRDFRCKNAQGAANALVAAEQQEHEASSWMTALTLALEGLCDVMCTKPRNGRCLIVLTETESENETRAINSSSDRGTIDVSLGSLPNDLDVVVVVGGVHLKRQIGSVASPLRTSPPKPVLSLSLTINTASVLDLARYRSFAEDLQKLVEFPELCED